MNTILNTLLRIITGFLNDTYLKHVFLQDIIFWRHNLNIIKIMQVGLKFPLVGNKHRIMNNTILR